MPVDLGLISEDLRQRVLTAIASELERDEAERRRSAQEQDGAGKRFVYRVLATEHAVGVGDAADANDATPANGGSADPENGSGAYLDIGSRASLDDTAGAGLDYDISPVPGSAPPWDQDELWPGTPVQQRGTPNGDAAVVGRGAAEDATAAREPEERAQPADARDPAVTGDSGVAADGAAAWPAVPLPRRAPGASGAPPPPAELRRDYLPPSVLGRRLEPEPYSEPVPRTSSGQSVFSPVRPAATSPAAPDPAGSPAEPGPSASGPSTAEPAEAPAEPVPPGTPPAEAVPPGTESPDSVPPRPAPSASAIAAASAPTMPVGGAALAAASAPTMPAGSAELATAASAFAPPAEPVQDQAPPPVPPMPAPSSSPAPSPPGGYGWVFDPGGESPGTGRGGGTAAPLPAAVPAVKRPRRSGRPYRIAGVILAVVALVVAAVVALELSSKSTPRHGTGLGPPAGGTGAMVRKRAAAWVVGQVSPAAVVACDPVMCQALSAHGVAAGRLYRLGLHPSSPLRSQVIVATAVVRAQFGNVLGSVYAPAVLASFGFGPDRIDIRATAQHGAAAYRAMLSADLAARTSSGTQLLHGGRIAANAVARRELAEGEVDGRLLITIAKMAATHPVFIVDFGHPAPGAAPGMPLRQADLAADANARHHAGSVISTGYVRAMVSFLRAQHSPFRPARVHAMRLADGAAVLRIEFTAPSPLGLLGPQA